MAARLASLLALRRHYHDWRSVTRLEERQRLIDEGELVVVDIEGDDELTP